MLQHVSDNDSSTNIDLVWWKLGKARKSKLDGKLEPNWEGTYRVVDSLYIEAYNLKELNCKLLLRTLNATHLKMYYSYIIEKNDVLFFPSLIFIFKKGFSKVLKRHIIEIKLFFWYPSPKLQNYLLPNDHQNKVIQNYCPRSNNH